MTARLVELAFEALDLGTELAAEEMDGPAAEIRIGNAMNLLQGVVDELNFAFRRAFATPEEKAQLRGIAQLFAEAMPQERRFT